MTENNNNERMFKFSSVGVAILLFVIVLSASSVGSFLAISISNANVKGVSINRGATIAQSNSGFSGLLEAIFGRKSTSTPPITNTESTNTTITPTTTTSNLTSTAVDLTKLPLGDKKYSTSAKQGYVYSCQTSFTGGGAFTQGPWINSSAGTWDLTRKVYVDGNVAWSNATWKVSSSGSTRTLTGNALPVNHTTGVYPISTSDDAYSYDRNPNTISAQTVSLSLPTNPTLLTTPQCVGGEVGVMLSGVPIYNAFDAGGRDAVATEIQDFCGGHPQKDGVYHYHGYNKCQQNDVSDTSDGHSGLIGYALDGFGIFGPKSLSGQEVSSADLDECHGHTHSITWDGKLVNLFHYHMTYDFPYSVGCFRAQAKARQVTSSGGGGQEGPGGMTGGGQQAPSGMPSPSGLPPRR